MQERNLLESLRDFVSVMERVVIDYMHIPPHWLTVKPSNAFWF